MEGKEVKTEPPAATNKTSPKEIPVKNDKAGSREKTPIKPEPRIAEKTPRSASSQSARDKNSSSGRKRKSLTPSEPRTPGKRQRVPVQRFQSPADEMIHHPSSFKAEKTTKEEPTKLYRKGLFLAVRGDEGTFYLCRTHQNVFNNTRHFKIQWLDLEEDPDIYKFSFMDHTEIECVLTNVRMERMARETYRLPHSEKIRVESILSKALRKEAGEEIDEAELMRISGDEDDNMEDEDDENLVSDALEDSEDEDWEEEEEEETPSKKKRGKKTRKSRVTPKTKATIEVKPTVPKKSGEKKKSPGKRNVVKKSPAEKKERKKGPDRFLNPNPKIKIVEKDPLFETKDHVPFISKMAHSKLIFRAVMQSDNKLLKQLLDDDQHIYSVQQPRSLMDKNSPLLYALKSNNMEAVRLLIEDIQKSKEENKRLKAGHPPQMIKAISKGSFNPASLGVSNIRALKVSRGAKEGNEAFIKESDDLGFNDVILAAIKMGVTVEALKELVGLLPNWMTFDYTNYDHVIDAVVKGHRALAGKMVAEAFEKGGFGFNFLHKDVLNFEGEELKPFQSASARKKPLSNMGLTPLHCACINPNTKYLEKILAVEPDINLEDTGGRRPIHYAAACEKTGPLELLLKKGANPNEVSRKKFTALHYACYAERPANVELLLSRAKQNNDMDELMVAKWGIGGMDRPNNESVCPLHLAVQNGDVETVKVLLKHGVNVNKQLSAGKEKVTPLMIAAGLGNLAIARLLVEGGAVIEQPDKFKRTALTHAVMNGSVPVASYLLFMGADPQRCDSSGNSLVHYAAAYGWYFVLKLLVNEGGANPAVANIWNLTPVGIAFMKGHTGLVDFLLKMPGVDINFKNDEGMTLLSLACSFSLSNSLYEQVVYLKEKGADATILDVNGLNALHHLASNAVKNEEQMDITVRIAEVLLKMGVDPRAKTMEKKTAISLAVSTVNHKLIKLLVERGGAVSSDRDADGRNALHLLSEQCLNSNVDLVLQLLTKQNIKGSAVVNENGLDNKMEMDEEVAPPMLKKTVSMMPGEDILKHMVGEVDNEGYSPLLLACKKYQEHKKPYYMSDDEFKKKESNGLNYLKTLLSITHTDVSRGVQKKKLSGPPPKEEKDHYGTYGKFTAVHFVLEKMKQAKIDSCDALKIMLDGRPNLETRDLKGRTPLVMAVEYNLINAVQMLLDAGANVNVTFTINEGTKDQALVGLLIMAAEKGQLSIVKMLIKAGVDTNVIHGKTKQTPLHLACRNRGSESQTLDIVGALLDGGCKVNALDYKGRSPLHLAVNANAGTSDSSTDVEELLLRKGADPYLKDKYGRMPLVYIFSKIHSNNASLLDPVELLGVLLTAMKGERVDEPDVNHQTPLHFASMRGASICCIQLLNRKANINMKDKFGNTPLSYALSSQKHSGAITLIQKGAIVTGNVVPIPPEKDEDEDEEEAEKKKKTPPCWQWKPLLKEKKKPQTYSMFQEAVKQDLQGITYLMLDNTPVTTEVIESVLKVSKLNMAQRLLKRVTDNGSLQQKNKQGQTLLHVLAACKLPSGDEDLILKTASMLHSKGVRIGDVDMYGCTPLHYAALCHKPCSLARFFFEKCPSLDINAKDKMNRTAFSAFIWNHTLPINSGKEEAKWLELFKEKKANFDGTFFYPQEEQPTFDFLSEKVHDYLEAVGSDKIPAISLAIRQSNFMLVRYLIQNGASLNTSDDDGLTPLMYAVRQNKADIVRLLLNPVYEQTSDSSTRKEADNKTKDKTFNIIRLNEEDEDDNDDDDDGNSEDDENDEDFKDEDANDEEEDEEEKDDQEDDEEDEHIEEELENDDNNDEDEEEEDDVSPETFPSLTKAASSVTSLKKFNSQEQEFKTVEKTSPIELDRVDKKGWSAVHHVVCSLDYGTYDNEEILVVLAKAGANTQIKDSAGLTPLDHALIKSAFRIARQLQKLNATEDKKVERPTSTTQEVAESYLDGSKPYDYVADSDAMLKLIYKSETSASDEPEPVAKPDPNLQMEGDVMMDDKQKIPYDVLLSKVDVSFGYWGMYNFYKMQIIWQKGIDVYVLFTRWGRIGDEGNFQHTPFKSKDEAAAEFCKIFRSKTGNSWDKLNEFSKQSKKYHLVPREEKPQKEQKVEFNLKSDIPSKLPVKVQELLKEMADVKMMDAAVNKASLDFDYFPFGKMKRETLLQGRKILLQIGDLIKEGNALKTAGLSSATEQEKYSTNREMVSKLTNEYYQLVPHHGFSFTSIQPIDDLGKLKTALRAISDYLDIECASKILLAAQFRLSEANPLDYVYQALQCRIEPLEESCVESQYILKYIHSSCPNKSVHGIYKISRRGEEKRMNDLGLDNHRLLWHGSSMANFLSILRQGLLVAPTEAPLVGSLFGEGIYSADTFAKSVNYCYNTSPTSNMNLCLLCEVALGKIQEIENLNTLCNMDDLRDTEYDSRKGLGSNFPDKNYDVTLPYGAVLPTGMEMRAKSKRCLQLRYNEYIVQNPSQVCIRYIVQFSKA